VHERSTFGLVLSACGRFLVSLLVIGLATTCLLRFAPGFGVDERELDTRLSNESIEELRKSAGSQDIFTSYYQFLRKAAARDLGFSRSLNRPVGELIEQRYATSVRILSLGLGAAWLNAFLLAAMGAVLKARVIPIFGVLSGSLILCIPSALLAYLCYIAGAPAFLVVALVVFARLFRVIDNLFQSARQKTHILAARSQGLREIRIFTKHVLSASGAELVALGGASVSMAVSATIAAEALCDEPGLGQLAWKAALARDLPLLVSLTLIIGAVTLFFNRGADMLAAMRRTAA
jgi:peptide/nickel transport system permease protein